MDKICKICNEEFTETNHFWLAHRTSLKTYFHTFYPRYSKLTNKPIPFKSPEQYLSQDFADKNELKKWLKDNPGEALDYALNLIQNRFDEGKIIYAPSQVELRSLCSPNVIWYENLCNYNLECQKIGLKTRFKYKVEALRLSMDRVDITIDSREQRPLLFKDIGKTIIKKLNYGDYHSPNSKWNHVFVERKNLSDFVGTLSKGYERFEREIIRAQSDNNYLVVLIEEPINNALAFNMLPHISRNIKASPDFIFHKVRKLTQDYPNIQFLFSDGRKKAQEIILKIYTMTDDPSLLDLQYLLDRKIL